MDSSAETHRCRIKMRHILRTGIIVQAELQAAYVHIYFEKIDMYIKKIEYIVLFPSSNKNLIS